MIVYAVVDDALSPDFPFGVVKRQVRKLASRILAIYKARRSIARRNRT